MSIEKGGGTMRRYATWRALVILWKTWMHSRSSPTTSYLSHALNSSTTWQLQHVICMSRNSLAFATHHSFTQKLDQQLFRTPPPPTGLRCGPPGQKCGKLPKI